MKLYIHPIRKDGKHPSMVVFENGNHLSKLFTPEQLKQTIEKYKPEQVTYYGKANLPTG